MTTINMSKPPHLFTQSVIASCSPLWCKQRPTYQLGLVLDGSPGVAVRVQEHLGVGVNGDEGLDVAMGPHKVNNRLDLRLRVGPESMVSL